MRGMDRIDLAQDGDRWPFVSHKMREFHAQLRTCSLLRKTSVPGNKHVTLERLKNNKKVFLFRHSPLCDRASHLLVKSQILLFVLLQAALNMKRRVAQWRSYTAMGKSNCRKACLCANLPTTIRGQAWARHPSHGTHHSEAEYSPKLCTELQFVPH